MTNIRISIARKIVSCANDIRCFLSIHLYMYISFPSRRYTNRQKARNGLSVVDIYVLLILLILLLYIYITYYHSNNLHVHVNNRAACAYIVSGNT